MTGAAEAPAQSVLLVVLGIASLAVGLLIDLRRRSRGIRRLN